MKGLQHCSWYAMHCSGQNLSCSDLRALFCPCLALAHVGGRSAIPVVTCVLAIVVESRYPTGQELWALITLTSGVMLAVWQGTVSGKPYAIVFCLVGTVCNGAMMTFSGKLLSEKLDVVRLTFYTAPVSLVCLAPFYWMYEVRAMRCWLVALYVGCRSAAVGGEELNMK